MKKILFILAVTAFLNHIQAQVVFCAPGSEWRHQFRSLSPVGYKSNIYYSGDTVIASETLKVLHYRDFFTQSGGSFCNFVLIRQKGDTIFMNTCNTKGTWQILYNFAATTGQSWTTSIMDSSNYSDHILRTTTVTVLSTGTVNINSMTLKKLHVTYCYISPWAGNPYTCDTTDIIERIGCTTYMFNYPNRPQVSDWNMFTDFLCYKDNTLGVKEFSSLGCNYDVGIHERSLNQNILALYPQPVDKMLNLELNETAVTITLINASGQVVLSAKPESSASKLQLDVSTLPAGIYSLHLFDGKSSASRKIIKE